jgi:hypothetical protein
LFCAVKANEEIAMARYYFHFKNGVELIKDEEGSELPTLDEARLQALKAGAPKS